MRNQLVAAHGPRFLQLTYVIVVDIRIFPQSGNLSESVSCNLFFSRWKSKKGS